MGGGAGCKRRHCPGGAPAHLAVNLGAKVVRHLALRQLQLRAAGLLAAEGRHFKLVLVEWGKEVAHSKALIEELGLADHVRWVSPMTKSELWAAYCKAHVVVDQFVLPAIGGVGFETLALGRRLITRIDEATLTRFFGACPPIMNAGSVREAEQCIRHVLDDPNDSTGIGVAGRNWIRDYHSAERVVSLQLLAYNDILEARERISASGEL